MVGGGQDRPVVRRGRADEQFISQLFTVSLGAGSAAGLEASRLAKATYAHTHTAI